MVELILIQNETALDLVCSSSWTHKSVEGVVWLGFVFFITVVVSWDRHNQLIRKPISNYRSNETSNQAENKGGGEEPKGSERSVKDWTFHSETQVLEM